MLKTIVNYSVKLASFVLALELVLYQPQMQHLIRLVDVLIVCDSRKTLSNLYRLFVEELDPKTAADFLRESPWTPGEVNQARQRFMLTQFLKLADRLGPHVPLRVSVDHSLLTTSPAGLNLARSASGPCCTSSCRVSIR